MAKDMKPNIMKAAGVCGLVGSANTGTAAWVDINTLPFGRTILGVVAGRSGPSVFIPQVIELWRQGLFPFDRLVKFIALRR
jgi:aryl-alcohol dehydrogenase